MLTALRASEEVRAKSVILCAQAMESTLTL